MSQERQGGAGGLVLLALILLALAAGSGKHTHASGTASVSSADFSTEQGYAQAYGGYSDGEMSCLIDLWNGESGWNPWAVNQQSGGYGIPQALPSVQGYPYALGAWKKQIRWGVGYISRVYGDPCTAWNDWLSRSPHWY